MHFDLPPLPYAKNALEPHISQRTVEFHYEKHHQGYLDKLRGLIEGTPDARLELSDLVREASGAVFNNAAQVWNHTFYWNSMAPGAASLPRGALSDAIHRDFDSLDQLQAQFVDRAVRLFGSGYVWLSFDPRADKLVLDALKDADSPLLEERVPLLGMDVWEHAYYLDYQNERNRYARAFIGELANWEFAAENFEKAA